MNFRLSLSSVQARVGQALWLALGVGLLLLVGPSQAAAPQPTQFAPLAGQDTPATDVLPTLSSPAALAAQYCTPPLCLDCARHRG